MIIYVYKKVLNKIVHIDCRKIQKDSTSKHVRFITCPLQDQKEV